jgi:hypothetical protein
LPHRNSVPRARRSPVPAVECHATGPTCSVSKTTEAQKPGDPAIERFGAAPADEGLVIRGIWLLRPHALLAGAHGDEVRYREYRVATATWRKRLVSGAIAWAEAMP